MSTESPRRAREVLRTLLNGLSLGVLLIIVALGALTIVVPPPWAGCR